MLVDKNNSVSLRWKSTSFFLQVLTESVRNRQFHFPTRTWPVLAVSVLLYFVIGAVLPFFFRLGTFSEPALQSAAEVLEQGPHSDQEPFCAGEIIDKSIYYK